MGRRAKPPKGKAEAKRSLARRSPKDEGSGVRDLEQQLEARNRELVEAQEQQPATSEILRVISTSPSDAHRHGGRVDGAAAPGRHDGPCFRRALRPPRRGRVAGPREQAPRPAPCRKPSSSSRRRVSKPSTIRHAASSTKP